MIAKDRRFKAFKTALKVSRDVYCLKEYKEACSATSMKVMEMTQAMPTLSRWTSGPLGGHKLIAARFRLGTHALRDVLGRRADGPVSRACPCCGSGEAEDVEHFLVSCDSYAAERQAAFLEFKGEGIDASVKDNSELMCLLLGSPGNGVLSHLSPIRW